MVVSELEWSIARSSPLPLCFFRKPLKLQAIIDLLLREFEHMKSRAHLYCIYVHALLSSYYSPQTRLRVNNHTTVDTCCAIIVIWAWPFSSPHKIILFHVTHQSFFLEKFLNGKQGHWYSRGNPANSERLIWYMLRGTWLLRISTRSRNQRASFPRRVSAT